MRDYFGFSIDAGAISRRIFAFLTEMEGWEMSRVEQIGDDLTALAVGVAGEHLVCADLLLRGFNAFRTDQNCPYDIAVEVNSRLVKIQVKTTRKERAIPQRMIHTPAYLFFIKRCGRSGKKLYTERDFDIMALVALDIKQIAYIKMTDAKRTLHINRAKFAALADIRRLL